jgi:hypothetical protein
MITLAKTVYEISQKKRVESDAKYKRPRWRRLDRSQEGPGKQELQRAEGVKLMSNEILSVTDASAKVWEARFLSWIWGL